MSYRQTNIFDFLLDSFTSNINNIEDSRRQREAMKYSFSQGLKFYSTF